MEPITLEQLALKIENGDKEAEQVLFQKFSPRIELIVRSRLPKNTAYPDMQDIVHDVTISLLEALRKGYYDESRKISLPTYTAGIAHKQVALYLRGLKRNREYTQEEMPEVEDDHPSSLDRMIDDEVKEKLIRKLSTLKSLHKKVLILRFYNNKSVSAISKLLGFKHKKVIDLTHYALKTFIKKCRNDDYFSIFSLLLQIFM